MVRERRSLELPKQTATLYITCIFTLWLQSAVCETQCTFGVADIDNNTSTFMKAGHYVDLDNPLTCSGNITSVHYCFYSDNVTNSSQSGNYSFTVRIWRETENNSYTKAHEYEITNGTANQEELIIKDGVTCKRVTLSTNFFAESGDVLGIYFNDPIGLLTTNSLTSTPEVTAASRPNIGLYYDNRSVADVRDQLSLSTSELTFDNGIKYHLEVHIIGNELNDSTISTMSVSHTGSSTTSEHTSSQKLTSILSSSHQTLQTSSLLQTASVSKNTKIMSQTSTHSTAISNTSVITPSTNSQTEDSLITTLSNSRTLTLPPQPEATIRPSTSAEIIPTSIMPSVVTPRVSGTPRLHKPKSNFSLSPTLIAGIAVLIVLVVLFVVVMVVIVCLLVARSRKVPALVQATNVNSLAMKDSSFIIDNPNYTGTSPDHAIGTTGNINAVNSMESSHSDSQGRRTDTALKFTDPNDIDRVSKQLGLRTSAVDSNHTHTDQNKHVSVHLYNTIETIQRQYPGLEERSFRTLSELHDYDELVPDQEQNSLASTPKSSEVSLVSNARSTENSARPTSSSPIQYEVPLSSSVSSSRCSSDSTLRCSSSLSGESWQEPVSWNPLVESTYIAMDSDFDLWRSHNEALQRNEDMQTSHRKRTESQSRSRASMDGPYSCPPSSLPELHKTLKDLSVEVISTKDIKTHLGMLQLSLPSQKAVLRRKSVQGDREVTIKAPEPDSTDSASVQAAQIDLLREAVIMAQIRHPNVAQLHGVIMEEDKLMLVMEQFPKEDLRRYLVQMGRSVIPPDAPKLLLSFSQQVALGMHYLSSKGFVHRDLAARSIFVTRNDTCKVGELGKCLEYANAEQYVINGGKLPVRWMAPEAMYRQRYSTASDVWSYGCLLYEIWSLGRMPFRNYTNAEVIEKVDSGYRIPPPPGCPRLIYDLMIQCWHPNPLSRPSFKELINSLLGDESKILQIPIRDASTHEAAIILGAPLEGGEYLYRDLQTRYVTVGARSVSSKSNSAREQEENHSRHSDYDHILPSGPKFIMAFPTSSADIDHMYKGRKGQGSATPKSQTSEVGSSFDSDFDISTTSFRQRLLTDEKSDYEDIGD